MKLVKFVNFKIKNHSKTSGRSSRDYKILQRVYILKLKMDNRKNDEYNLSSRFLSFFRFHLQRKNPATEAGLAEIVRIFPDPFQDLTWSFSVRHKACNVYKNIKNI